MTPHRVVGVTGWKTLNRFARLDDREVWDRLHFEEGCIGMEMHRRGYDPADEYQARRYGPDRLAREIIMRIPLLKLVVGSITSSSTNTKTQTSCNRRSC